MHFLADQSSKSLKKKANNQNIFPYHKAGTSIEIILSPII